MIAIAKIGGHQYLVKEGDKLEVDKLDLEVGKTISFEVLLVSDEDGNNCKIGTPLVEGTTVTAKIIEHGRGDKIRVYKMKPRKRYRRTLGHRQDYTAIEITKIGSGSAKAAKKPTEKKETPAAAAKPKAATKKAPAKKTEKKVEKADK
ncbi:MAG: 50S ribosomal protein L21 [Candidatus Peregrinibacteria bacterium]|nr:50S ribosomal protein L21 [Candidatus Peregrinibacteria bacterium]